MAEEIWYSIVWEKEKTQNNVIDYNIREEITKDTSAIENANNQTTTGMATQIPWVNEPKLIAKTSIIWWAWWWGWAEIVEISQWDSIDEWQPVVERVLNWEFVCVRCLYTPYSHLINLFFTPCYYIPDQAIRFGATYVWSYWARINCWVTWTTINSITWAYWQRNTNA